MSSIGQNEQSKKPFFKGIRDQVTEWISPFLKKKGEALLENIIDIGTNHVFTLLKDKFLNGQIDQSQITKFLSGTLDGAGLHQFLAVFKDGSHANALIGAMQESNFSTMVKKFINDPTYGPLLKRVSEAGIGATEQVVRGLEEKKYQEWLASNPMPDNVTQTIKSESDPDYYLCEFCQTTFKSKPDTGACTSCMGSNGLVGMKVVPSQKMTEWLRQSDAKQAELRIGQAAAVTATSLGALVVSIGPDLLEKLGPTLGIHTGQFEPPPAVDKLVVKDTIDTPENTEEALKWYKILQLSARQRGLTKDRAKTPPPTGEVYLYDNLMIGGSHTPETFYGPIIVMGKLSVMKRGVTIEGDLIVFGELSTVQQFNCTGTVYVVRSDELNIQAKVPLRFEATETTVTGIYHVLEKKGYIAKKS